MESEPKQNFLQEENYNDLFNNAHDLIHIVDLRGNIIYVNTSWIKTLGYPLHDIQGHSIYDFISEDDREKYLNYRKRVMNNDNSSAETIINFISKDGRKIVLEGFVSARIKDGQLLYTRGIFRDITTKIAHEAELRKREKNLTQLLLNAPDAIVVINPESHIIFWNPAAEKLFGWSTDEVINQPLSSTILPRRHRDAHYNGMQRYLDTGVEHVLNKTVEITAVNKSGEEFFISLTISQTTYNANVAFISFIRDIRLQKTNEAELENKRQQLEQTNTQLEQFAHVASHDMKEPVRKIKLFSERLRNELGNGISDLAKNYLGKIDSASERLNKMVEGTLKYAIASNIESEFEAIDLNNILSNVTEDLEVPILQTKAIINFDALPVIQGVNFLIYQLFYNLINNSLKFSKQALIPMIDITCREVSGNELPEELAQSEKKYFQIEIKDNGIGFQQSYADVIFKTFTRLNNRSDFEGTGLGLSLCKNIMERHKGLITADGTEGEGATFTMFFPGTN